MQLVLAAWLSPRGLERLSVVWLLLWLRSAPLFWFSGYFALRVRLGLGSLVLSALAAFALLPIALAAQPLAAPTSALPWACLAELVRGTVFGLGCALPFWLFESVGSFADVLRGTPPMAAVGEESNSRLGALYALASLLVFLTTSAHAWLLRGFVQTLDQVPLGAALFQPQRGALLALSQLVIRAFEIGVALSAPILLCAWLLSVLFGLLLRITAASRAGLAGLALWPWLGLGVVCLSIGSSLDQVPRVARLFTQETARIFGLLH